MLIHIYILFWIAAFLLCFLSFYKKGMLILPWLATSFFFFLGITSYNIEIPFCESNVENYINSTLPRELEVKFFCHTYSKTDIPLGLLSYGLGLIMLIYSIYVSFLTAGETLEKGIK